ncbi:FabD/lysophospholipase-like protein [Diplogelasinospora grovesii]|uniref:FabD/lysophospholipase-like protein n=1 Tax=Diplogelasinospora grovesii TaxID=303347 RepID=A0AAN6S683_9PEZI|nr:FabD/lysophospholipase-like protein [Diplogelasinospora grovesii]
MADTIPLDAATQDGSDPWAMLVLSLDGGGVRGLSSLYILRGIMNRIQEIDDAAAPGDQMEQDSNQLPLPCHYFDLMVGTSTGGLIAIMLGRLRMGVNDCIQQYWIMANRIFRPRRVRFLQLYSRRKVQDAAKDVVKQFCRCHGGRDECGGVESLRQYDYKEQGGRANQTCKVAVTTVREFGKTSHSQGDNRGDFRTLFRSYDHARRIDLSDPAWADRNQSYERNPRELSGAKLDIHEACVCTSMGPTYFKSVKVRGRRFIDGGVWANNPAVVAWHEATQMANPPPQPWVPTVFPRLLLSVGTGKSKQHTRFGNVSLARSMIAPDAVHHDAQAKVIENPGPRYFRFDVPEKPGHSEHKGLSGISMDECKKKKKPRAERRTVRNNSQAQAHVINGGNDPPQSSPEVEQTQVEGQPPPGPQARPTWKEQVQVARDLDAAPQADADQGRKGYRPSKYRYLTFDKIRDRTVQYLSSNISDDKRVSDHIDGCARLLWSASLERRNNDRDRWDRFRQHPDPRYHVG